MARERILVVEDENIVALDIQSSLEHLGFQVPAMVKSGVEAIQKAKELMPDLVLMDIQIQGPIDGIEAAERIYKNLGIPIVYLTAYADKGTLERAKSTQPFGYIIKPFDERELYTAVEIALSRHRNMRERDHIYQEAIEASQEEYALVIDSVKDYAIFMLTLEGKIKSWNIGAERIKGYHTDEVLGQHFSIFYPQEERRSGYFVEVLDEAIREGRYEEERILVRKSGSKFWAHITITPVQNKKGDIIGFAKVTQDISQRKQAELALQSQQKRTENLIAQMPGVVWEAYGEPDSSSQRMNFVSEYVEKMLGYSVQEWLSTPNFWLKIVHPHDKESAAKRSSEIFQSGQGGENQFRWVTKQGKVLWVESHASVIKDENGNPIGMRGINFDITDRKRTEDWQKFLAESSKILASSLDYQKTLQNIVNLAVPELADWAIVDILSKKGTLDGLAIAHVDPNKVKAVEEFRQKYPLRIDIPLGVAHVAQTGRSELIPDLSKINFEKLGIEKERIALMQMLGLKSCICVPLIVRGKTLGVLTFISSSFAYNNMDLKLSEELAHRAALAVENAQLYKEAQELIKIRDEFLSIASHELKTPISSLKLQLQLVKRSIKPELNIFPTAERLLKTIDMSNRQIDRLARLVDDLLDVSRIQAGRLSFNFENVKLSEVVQDVVERLCDSQTMSYELDLDENIMGCWDRSRIEQVLTNLVSNVLKYAPNKPFRIETHKLENSAVLIVQDYGPGIPKEMQNKIFERFERGTHSQNVSGLGLGLFISKQIVLEHGGSIRVESEVNMGSRFIVELPLAASQQEWKEAVG